jgi:hypothetical protein
MDWRDEQAARPVAQYTTKRSGPDDSLLDFSLQRYLA